MVQLRDLDAWHHRLKVYVRRGLKKRFGGSETIGEDKSDTQRTEEGESEAKETGFDMDVAGADLSLSGISG